MVSLVAARRVSAVRPGWTLEGVAYGLAAPPFRRPPPPDPEAAHEVQRSLLSGPRATDMRRAIAAFGRELEGLRHLPEGAELRARRRAQAEWREAAEWAQSSARGACEAVRDLLRNRQVRIDEIRSLDEPPRRIGVLGVGAVGDPRVVFGSRYATRLEPGDAPRSWRALLTLPRTAVVPARTP
jgi:hypothetical protein